jgi:hypothetical protein
MKLRWLLFGLLLVVSTITATLGLASIVGGFDWHLRRPPWPEFHNPGQNVDAFRRGFLIRGMSGHVQLQTDKLVYGARPSGLIVPLPGQPMPPIAVLTLVNHAPVLVQSPPWVFPPFQNPAAFRLLKFGYSFGMEVQRPNMNAMESARIVTFQLVEIPCWAFFVPGVVCCLICFRRLARPGSRPGFQVLPANAEETHST